MDKQLTNAQQAAVTWLRKHGGDGLFCKDGVLLAGGERAPFMRGTLNALAAAGYVEFYGKGRGRVRLTDAASKVPAVPDDDLEARQCGMAPHPMDDDYPESSNG